MPKLPRPHAPTTLHVVRAELVGSSPRIYRALELRSDVTLGTLHRILQIAFGWHDGHLHEFRTGRRRYANVGVEVDPFDEEDDAEDEDAHLLSDVLPAARSKLIYAYDFGDSWEVAVKTVRIVDPPSGRARPPVARLTGGALAAPPEDCGGISGFYELCEILRKPAHPEHEDRLEWVGDDFDPAVFDAETVEKRLKKVK